MVSERGAASQMALTDWTCPVARAARLLGDGCALLIVRDLEAGPRRFGDLLGSAAGNTRLLSGRLRRLTAAGILDRHDCGGRPPRVEYSLTPMGRDLLPVIASLRLFAECWLPEPCDPLPATNAAATPPRGRHRNPAER